MIAVIAVIALHSVVQIAICVSLPQQVLANALVPAKWAQAGMRCGMVRKLRVKSSGTRLCGKTSEKGEKESADKSSHSKGRLFRPAN